MSTQKLKLVQPHPANASSAPRQPLGRHLLDRGVITQEQLVQALQMQLKLGAPVGEILVSDGFAARDDILDALAVQSNAARADLLSQRPNPVLCDVRDFGFWMRHKAIPWMRLGETVLVATTHPDQFDSLRQALADTFPDILPVIASEEQITGAIADHFRAPMAQAAGTRLAPQFSCRTWGGKPRLSLLLMLTGLIAAFAAAPLTGLAILSCLAVMTLMLFAGLKLAALTVFLRDRDRLTAPAPARAADEAIRLPKVSVLVPLFREREIASALIRRLSRLTYPKALLDVVLVLEEKDTITRDTLAETDLPSWMRVVEVPAHGRLTTKPRAMNYALDFCHGDIIGVWDAEDAPAPDQVERIAARFAEAPDDVVCLQGVLDYYNPRTNWIARCFTIEYASWFRVVLPGIARLGLVVPLGGTTLFFRRDKLEELGGWDAHNVTEDAELGMRLCRAGYRTEVINTVTYEEANHRPWRWIRQRSRWLKGFMVTYLVHMRSPVALFRDLGALRFLSFQAFFLGTLCQFLLAPLLWSFWLLLLGYPHPISAVLPATAVPVLAGLFLGAELLTLIIAMLAVTAPERRNLMGWVLTMPFYFPLGAVAAYKALIEMVLHPFYWDKTQHGQAGMQINVH